MFEWLNKLKVGDNVLVRDYEPLPHRRNGFPSEEYVETVIEVTDKFIKTEPLDYVRPKILAAFRLFRRRFGSCGSIELIRKIA